MFWWTFEELLQHMEGQLASLEQKLLDDPEFNLEYALDRVEKLKKAFREIRARLKEGRLVVKDI